MRVVLLGTGAAGGSPNAFCEGASCRDMLRNGVVRGPTSALVDGTVLLDCPDTPRAASRAGTSLAGVRMLLLSQDRPDDSTWFAVLARERAGAHSPVAALDVIGAAPTLERWRSAVGPDDPDDPDDPDVHLVPAEAGDRLAVDGPRGSYVVDVLAAGDSDGDSDRGSDSERDQGLVYLVSGPDGSLLAYAAGDGPLPEPTVAALDGRRLDLLLTGDTGADHVRQLRASGAVDERTMAVAVHLSHHHPGASDTRPPGARPGRDLETIAVGADATAQPTGWRTLVLGAARSGKSTVAERLLADRCGPVTYVATGPAAASDPEWAERVRAHRARRPASWRTIETRDVAGVLGDATGPVLVDCLTLWLTAVLDDAGAWDGRAGWRSHLDKEVARLADAWAAATVPVVAVSNEVGAGVVPGTAAGRLFRDEQGRLNARLAASADRCLLVVAGRTLELPVADDVSRR